MFSAYLFLVVLATATATPEKECESIGEYMRDISNRCYFYQCTYANAALDLEPTRLRCAPGTTVRHDYVMQPGDANPCHGINLPCIDETGEWSPWGEWGECSVTCGGGVSVRSRTCSIPGTCEGPSEESRVCNTQACFVFTNWTNKDTPLTIDGGAWGGDGDFETDFGAVCGVGNPIVDIECRTVEGHIPSNETYLDEPGVFITRCGLTPIPGIMCVNAATNNGTCVDFETRFLCPNNEAFGTREVYARAEELELQLGLVEESGGPPL
ncbi:thrombospondin-2 [Lingula anatina]|uniref:Thrombospondin-2 n=1 Tax=Lingula anatina TaxID=7574 RepID=A0A1S3I6R7_LINAN|nr:thrombospondin-2 [Lingula anatina]|eukprot:XP_013393952.1 thrombospondin-2 [Lingula anatina]